MKINDKTIMITGAVHGLGRELTLCLDKQGCSLILVDLDGQGLSLLIGDLAHRHQFIVCNLAEMNERNKLIQSIKEIANIEILINCAGIGSHSQLTQLTMGEIEKVLQVNTLAPLELIVGLSPLDLVVNIGSVAGEMSLPSMGLYAASKASLHAFTRAIQLEGIRALLVILGPMKGTDFFQSIEHPHTGQPKWYRDLDLDVKVAANKIIRAIQKDQNQIVIPCWYHVVFFFARLLMPVIKVFGRRFGT
jgi:short-subunit dehydrogenase